MQKVFNLRNCSIIRCDRRADWPHIGNAERKQMFHDQNLFRVFFILTRSRKIPGAPQPERHGCVTEVICRSTRLLHTIFHWKWLNCYIIWFSGMPETHRAGNLSSRATFFADIASNTSNRELRRHRLPIFEYSELQSPLLAEELSLSLSKSQQQRSSVIGEKDSRQLEFFAAILSSGFRQAQLEPFQQIITSLPLLRTLKKHT